MDLRCLFCDGILRLIDHKRTILSICRLWNRWQVFPSRLLIDSVIENVRTGIPCQDPCSPATFQLSSFEGNTNYFQHA
jgi:hypothetical protein